VESDLGSDYFIMGFGKRNPYIWRRIAAPLYFVLLSIMFENKRHSIRFNRLDYSLPNKFTVTICATKHGCYFDKFPKLTKITEFEISNINNYFNNVDITNFVIMPNHIHLIIEINYQVKSVTLGKIIGVLKGRIINKWLKMIEKEKINSIACIFQRNYFEHRIRNKEELLQSIKYIELNPLKWDCDRYNPINLSCRGFARRNPN
jgi:putative transposase